MQVPERLEPRESAEVRVEQPRKRIWKCLGRNEIEGGEGVAMYQFSRAIYRELAPYIASSQTGSTGSVAGSATAEPNSVLQVVQPGYELNGRLLRPARVIVAREPAPRS